MNFNSLRLYPRGFIGGGLKPQVERTVKPYGSVATQHQYRVNEHTSSSDIIAPNPNVEAVYSQYIKNSISVNSPEFRKRILTTVMDSFGTANFAVWFNTQFKSPAAGSLHNDFLVDMLRFIETGTRHLALESWAVLLHITDEGNNIGKMPEYAKDFFGMKNNTVPNKNINLNDVLQKWCSKAGGLEDMLYTAHILFGNP